MDWPRVLSRIPTRVERIVVFGAVAGILISIFRLLTPAIGNNTSEVYLVDYILQSNSSMAVPFLSTVLFLVVCVTIVVAKKNMLVKLLQ